MAVIERYREDGEPVRRLFLIAEVTFADRDAQPRDEYDHNYYEDSELADVAARWMRDGMTDRDDSPAVRFHDVPAASLEEIKAVFGWRSFGKDGTP